jgi:hypothetical protein
MDSEVESALTAVFPNEIKIKNNKKPKHINFFNIISSPLLYINSFNELPKITYGIKIDYLAHISIIIPQLINLNKNYLLY